MRLPFRRMALSLMAVLVLTAGCGAKPTPTAQPSAGGQATPSTAPAAPVRVRLRLDYSITGSHAPFIVAADKGFYEEEGVLVDVLEGSASNTTLTLVGAGKDQFGYASAPALVSAVSQDVPVVMTALLMRGSPYAIMYNKDAGIKSAKDLIGKKIGDVAGSTTERYSKALLKKNNVDINQVQFVALNSNALVPALLTKQIDAFAGFNSTYMPQLEAQNANAAFISFSDLGLHTAGLGIFTNADYLKKNPDVVRKVIKGSIRGLEFSQKNPAEAVKIMKDRFPRTLDEKTTLSQLQQSLAAIDSPNTKGKPLGFQSTEDWTATIDFLLSVGDIKAKPKDGFWTNDYLPK